MKSLLFFVAFLLAILNLKGQIQNGEFDAWTRIDTSGQPYDDLLYWDTNNEGLGNGLATTPNIRIQEGTDNGVAITTNYMFIDAISSGRIYQTISTDRLIDIDYLSKCDSIYENGACVVNIYDDEMQLVYTDSLKTKQADFTMRRISLSDLPNLDSDLITIEFEAAGTISVFNPIQGYAEFLLLNVNANYISSTTHTSPPTIAAFPNPFDSHINILHNHNETMPYVLFNAEGRLLKQGNESIINTRDLISGAYFIQFQTENGIITKQVSKR